MERIKHFVFTVEVFSRESEAGVLLGGPSLADLDYLINDGPHIGTYSLDKVGVVAPDQLEAELIRIGNDGTFFDDIDDNYGIDEEV